MDAQIVIGALLHDIGKFAQRANIMPDPEEIEIKEKCCPIVNGQLTEKHVISSAKFIREILGQNFRDAELSALYHHRPENSPNKRVAMIVAIADLFASGGNRVPVVKENIEHDQTVRLSSIFSNLKIGGTNPIPSYFPLKRLSMDLKSHFPDDSQEIGNSESYANLWKDFMNEARFLDNANHSRIIRQLLCLIEKYTLFMPATTQETRNDISLFHHLKSTSAIASCLDALALKDDELGNLYESLIGNSYNNLLEKESFYLVGGDLSGIQSFIYSVASRGALKGIRGRSIYLFAIVETIVESLLQTAQLNPTCLIYSGGGHFYLLAPKTDLVTEQLNLKREEINRVLVMAHRGKLRVHAKYTSH